MLILRTAWLAQSANLWATHASRAGEAGLTADDVRRIAVGPTEGWSPFEAVLLGLADELFRNAAVTDRTWDTLAAEYDLFNMVDAVVTVSETTSHAILFNSLGIQPDDDTTARIPTDDVAYRLDVPDREGYLEAPRIDPLAGDGLRVGRTFRRHPDMAAARGTNPGYVLNPSARGWSRTTASCSSCAPGGTRKRSTSGRSTSAVSAVRGSAGSSRAGLSRGTTPPAGTGTSAL